MKRWGLLIPGVVFFMSLAEAGELSTAPAENLMAVYSQLRSLHASAETAIVNNVVLKRDSATFTLISGKLTFAAPVEGRVLAAQFRGEGKFELQPPSDIDRRQIARFTGEPKATDTFQEAVFFFTDDSFAELGRQTKTATAPDAEKEDQIAGARKRFSERFNDSNSGYPTIRNLGARMLADLSDSNSKGFFLANFKAKKLGDLIFHISWNRDALIFPSISKGEEVFLLHLNPGNYYEWYSGFHLLSEYTDSAHPDHVEHAADGLSADIDLKVASDNHISATVDLEFKVTTATTRVLPFQLDGVLRISSITDANGNKVAFIQEDRKLDSDPWLLLPKLLSPGEAFKIKIAYQEDSTWDSRIVFQQGAGLYYVTARESWFPSFGAIDDRMNFTLRARSPKKYKFVASGARVSSETSKDELVTTWKSDIPFWVFGFNYGIFVESTQPASQVEVTAYAGKEVPDELKQVESIMSLNELAGYSREMADTGILRGGFNTAANVKYAASMSANALKLFQVLYGQLPYKRVAITEQPVRGYGQSWPNLVFLPYDSLLDATTRNSLGMGGSQEEREFYSLVAVHEMSHQWWGHLVGWKTYHDQWLSEGVAEHAAALYLRQFEPAKWDSYWELRRSWLLSKNKSGYRPVDAGPLWLNSQLDDKKESWNSNLIYYKGAYVLEMLRVFLYDSKNKDNRFIDMMTDFAKSYAGQNASTQDFQRIVEKHLGEPMDWFFNQWVYGSEVPTYDFSYKLSDAGGGQTELEMTITQSHVSADFRMRLPIYTVVSGSNRYLGTIQISGAEPYTVKVKLPVKPEKVLLDPSHSILAEIRQ